MKIRINNGPLGFNEPGRIGKDPQKLRENLPVKGDYIDIPIEERKRDPKIKEKSFYIDREVLVLVNEQWVDGKITGWGEDDTIKVEITVHGEKPEKKVVEVPYISKQIYLRKF